MTKNLVNTQLSAADSYTEHRSVSRGKELSVGFVVSGTFSGTVTFQLRYAGDSNWLDVHTVDSEASQGILDVVGPADVRAGFKSGEYTSGTANVVLAVED